MIVQSVTRRINLAKRRWKFGETQTSNWVNNLRLIEWRRVAVLVLMGRRKIDSSVKVCAFEQIHSSLGGKGIYRISQMDVFTCLGSLPREVQTSVEVNYQR